MPRQPIDKSKWPWCSKGTCQMNPKSGRTDHKPNANGVIECWMDPSWPGPLPERVQNNPVHLEAILKGRQENGKRMGVKVLKLLTSKPAAPVAPVLPAAPDDDDPNCNGMGGLEFSGAAAALVCHGSRWR